MWCVTYLVFSVCRPYCLLPTSVKIFALFAVDAFFSSANYAIDAYSSSSLAVSSSFSASKSPIFRTNCWITSGSISPSLSSLMGILIHSSFLAWLRLCAFKTSAFDMFGIYLISSFPIVSAKFLRNTYTWEKINLLEGF